MALTLTAVGQFIRIRTKALEDTQIIAVKKGSTVPSSGFTGYEKASQLSATEYAVFVPMSSNTDLGDYFAIVCTESGSTATPVENAESGTVELTIRFTDAIGAVAASTTDEDPNNDGGYLVPITTSEIEGVYRILYRKAANTSTAETEEQPFTDKTGYHLIAQGSNVTGTVFDGESGLPGLNQYGIYVLTLQLGTNSPLNGSPEIVISSKASLEVTTATRILPINPKDLYSVNTEENLIASQNSAPSKSFSANAGDGPIAANDEIELIVTLNGNQVGEAIFSDTIPTAYNGYYPVIKGTAQLKFEKMQENNH